MPETSQNATKTPVIHTRKKTKKTKSILLLLPLFWIILYDRYISSHAYLYKLLTLLHYVMLTVPKGVWATCGLIVPRGISKATAGFKLCAWV